MDNTLNRTLSASKPFKRLDHLLTYGNIWMYILSLLRREKEVYAYTLGERIEKEFSFKPNMIMLYVVLYKLETEGVIKAAHKKDDRRKYYVLTNKGDSLLKFAKRCLIKLGKKL